MNDIAAVITVYNQPLRSTLLSLASAALQQGCDVKVLVADDCSSSDHSATFKNFLAYVGARSFEIVRARSNLKTVANIKNALGSADAPYVKCFGSGDLLYARHTLLDIIEHLSNGSAPSGFGEIRVYQSGQRNGARFRAPRAARLYQGDSPALRRRLLREQLLKADWIPGGSQFFSTDLLERLLSILSEQCHVRYCEDFAMTLQLFESMPSYLQSPVLWYEFGGGISSSGNSSSVKRMYLDHTNFYREVARQRPYGSRYAIPSLMFGVRRAIALYTPVYGLLQRRCAASYVSPEGDTPLNQFFFECQETVDRFLSAQTEALI